jgi:hypothetical protein
MPLYAVGYLMESRPGMLGPGVSYRGGPAMSEAEAIGLITQHLMQKWPGRKLLAITALEIDHADIEAAAQWPRSPSSKETDNGR